MVGGIKAAVYSAIYFVFHEQVHVSSLPAHTSCLSC